MTNTKKYIGISLAILTVILMVVSAVAYFSGGSVSEPVLGVAAAAGLAAAAASRSRDAAKLKVEESIAETEVLSQTLNTQKEGVQVAIKKAEVEIKQASAEEKAKMGEDLLGPGGNS